MIKPSLPCCTRSLSPLPSRGHHRQSASLCFEDDISESICRAWKDEEIRRGIGIRQLLAPQITRKERVRVAAASSLPGRDRRRRRVAALTTSIRPSTRRSDQGVQVLLFGNSPHEQHPHFIFTQPAGLPETVDRAAREGIFKTSVYQVPRGRIFNFSAGICPARSRTAVVLRVGDTISS